LLDPATVAYAADLHRRALPGGFFARLGPGFLREYHRTFLEGPAAVALAGIADGRPAGMLVGTLDNAAHWRWALRNHGAALAVRGAAGLAAHPVLLRDFARGRAARYARAVARRLGPSDAGAAPDAGPPERVAVLTHVAVDTWARDHGLGARLVTAFVGAARAAGADTAALVTLAGPAGAGRFYERLGWTAVADRTDLDGHPITEYRLPLGAAQPAT